MERTKCNQLLIVVGVLLLSKPILNGINLQRLSGGVFYVHHKLLEFEAWLAGAIGADV